MPLRVRVTTNIGGANALLWLGAFRALAALYDGKTELEQDTPPDVVMVVSFSQKAKGAAYMNLLKPFMDAPLEAEGSPVILVEEVP